MSIRALAATAVALTLTATPACADSTAGLESTDTLIVLTMNAHGSTDRFGGGNRGRTAATSRDVSALVRKYRPDAIAAAGSSIDWVAGTAPRLVAAHAIGSSDHPAVVVATKERAS